MKLIPFRAPEALHRAAKRKAKTEGRTLSGYVRWLIKSDLERPTTKAEKTAK